MKLISEPIPTLHRGIAATLQVMGVAGTGMLLMLVAAFDPRVNPAVKRPVVLDAMTELYGWLIWAGLMGTILGTFVLVSVKILVTARRGAHATS